MNEKIRELKRSQEEVFREMETLRKKVTDEKRAYSPEEEESFDAMGARFDAFQKEVDREEKLEKRAALLAAHDDQDAQRPDPEGREIKPINVRATPEYARSFAKYLKGGEKCLNLAELRVLQMDDDEGGGYTVTSEQFEAKLIAAVDDQVFLRVLATILSCKTAHSLGVPTLETDASDAEWTTEIAAPTPDDVLAFGKRELYPHPLAKLFLVSEKMLRTSAIDVEGLIKDRMAQKFGAAQEKGFMTGTGVGQPLGIFTASDDGIPTTRDVKADNTTTALTAEGLINALYSLKPQYLKNSKWLFHRLAIASIRKIKDVTSGQFIWQPGLASDKQPSILDRPYIISEYVPHTFTTGLYVGMIADFSFYWIADALDMRIKNLDPLYALTNQVGFLGRLEVDGQPVLGEAFARVQLATE